MCEKYTGSHPNTKANLVVNKLYQTNIKLTFEEINRPYKPIMVKMCGVLLPEGTKADYQGVKKRKANKNRMWWEPVASTPSVISDISQTKEDEIHKHVQITFADALGENVYRVWVDTATAFRRGIARKLRNWGAVCTDNEGQRLANYFRECYDLRVDEVRRGMK